MKVMQTVIEFGKEFLVTFYTNRDAQESLPYLAEDVVWVTPEEVYHFRARAEELVFLQKEIKKDPARRYVDVESVMADSHTDGTRLVTYQVNLVPEDPENTVHLRCSLAMAPTAGGETYEVSFLHFSRIYERSGTEQIREFTNAIPAGIMILAYRKEEGVRSLYQNQYFYSAFGYAAAGIKLTSFQSTLSDKPFFLIEEEDRAKVKEALEKAAQAGREVSMTLRMKRADGALAVCELVARPTYQDENNTVYYCLFRDVSHARERHTKLRMTASLFAGIVSHLPTCICVLQYDGTHSKAVYVSDSMPAMLGVKMEDYLQGVSRDFFYGLQMTGVTKESLIKNHVLASPRDNACGIYPCVSDEKKWISLSVCASRDKDAGMLVYLTYTDRTKQREEEESLRRDNAALVEREQKRRSQLRESFETEAEKLKAGESSCLGLFLADITENKVQGVAGLLPDVLHEENDQQGQGEISYDELVQTFSELCRAAQTGEGGMPSGAADWARPLLLEQGAETVLPAMIIRYTAQNRLRYAQVQMELTDTQEQGNLIGYGYLRDVSSSEMLRRLENRAARNACDYIACLDGQADHFTMFYADEEGSAPVLPPRVGTYSEDFIDFYKTNGKKPEEFIDSISLEALSRETEIEGEVSCRIDVIGTDGRRRTQKLRFVRMDGAEEIYGIFATDDTATRMQEEKETYSYRNYYLEAAQESRLKEDFLSRLRAETEEPVKEILSLSAKLQQGPGASLTESGKTGAQITTAAREILAALQSIPETVRKGDSWKNIQERSFSYKEMMDGICAYVRSRCKARNLQFVLKPALGEIPEQMIGDRVKLEQALFSILDNAVKYTSAGGQITLQTQLQQSGGDKVLLRFIVQDTGSGIDEDKLPGLFDPFSGAPEGEVAPAGTGLGLSVARELIRRMGGSIQVRSEKGTGSTFTVSVQVRTEENEQ